MSTDMHFDSSSNALVDDFCNIFNISKPKENDTLRPHPKFATYNRRFEENIVKRLQDQRRKELLDNVKRKREQIIDNLRPLINLIENENQLNNTNGKSKINKVETDRSTIGKENNDVEEDIIMQIDPQINSNNSNKKHRNRRNNLWWQKNEKEFRRLVSKQLMLSEWLVDVPSDFYNDWYMVLCPRGKRTLLIAANGLTKIYSRSGYFMFHFQSLLPGGGRNISNHNTNAKSTILDCIYVEEEHMFYVLDLISWNGCTFSNCEAEFRFFWLQSRFNDEILGHQMANVSSTDVDMPEQSTASDAPILDYSISKLYNFVPLTYHDCTVENIHKYAKGPYQFNTEVDGVLFFHKRAQYTPGITPLVCWLKVPMISSILHISLN